jgi:glycosyltransferase involved in cell wall biosynthesis
MLQSRPEQDLRYPQHDAGIDRSVTISDQPLNICLLGYRSQPYSGGQGIYIKYLSKALVNAGHTVDVVSGEPYPHLDPRVRLIKLPGLNLFESPNHVTALRPAHLLSYTDFFEWFSMLTGGFPEPYTFGRRAFTYLKKYGRHYDIIHDNQSLCSGLLKLQKLGFPTVCTVHHPITSDREIALASAKSFKLRLLIRRWHSFLRMQTRVIRKLKYIVTVSEQSRTDISKAFGISENRISLIHNGIDTDVFKPMPEVPRLPFRLMTTASADVPLKGLEYLLRAIASLEVQYPDIELLVVGKLKEDGVTAQLIEDLQLGPRLKFVSGIETDELVRYYAEASIVIVPSIYEGFGLPAGEAMATGTAVIGTNGGALPEVIGDAGVLVPTRDEHAISREIKLLLDNPEQRKNLEIKGRERIENTFSWDVAAQMMTSYYKKVLLDAHANN